MRSEGLRRETTCNNLEEGWALFVLTSETGSVNLLIRSSPRLQICERYKQTNKKKGKEEEEKHTRFTWFGLKNGLRPRRRLRLGAAVTITISVLPLQCERDLERESPLHWFWSPIYRGDVTIWIGFGILQISQKIIYINWYNISQDYLHRICSNCQECRDSICMKIGKLTPFLNWIDLPSRRSTG